MGGSETGSRGRGARQGWQRDGVEARNAGRREDAETRNEPVTAHVSLDPAAHGIDVRVEGSLHRSGGGEEQCGEPGSDGHIVAEIELAPLEVVVWTLPRV